MLRFTKDKALHYSYCRIHPLPSPPPREGNIFAIASTRFDFRNQTFMPSGTPIDYSAKPKNDNF